GTGITPHRCLTEQKFKTNKPSLTPIYPIYVIEVPGPDQPIPVKMFQAVFAIRVVRAHIVLVFIPFVITPQWFFEIIRMSFIVSPDKYYIESASVCFGGGRFTSYKDQSLAAWTL